MSSLRQTHGMGQDAMSGVPDKTLSMVRGGYDSHTGRLLRQFSNPGKSGIGCFEPTLSRAHDNVMRGQGVAGCSL